MFFVNLLNSILSYKKYYSIFNKLSYNRSLKIKNISIFLNKILKTMMFSFCLILIITFFRRNSLSSIDLWGRDYRKVAKNFSNQTVFNMSHKEIQSIDDQVYGPNTQRIYLNDNRIRYINPNAFRNIYNLSELDLRNNRLQSLEINFNFVKGKTKETFVYLNGNVDLTLLS